MSLHRFAFTAVALALVCAPACKGGDKSKPAEKRPPAPTPPKTEPKTTPDEKPPETADLPKGTWYRAALEVNPEHQVRFFLLLPESPNDPAVIASGGEHVKVTPRVEGEQTVLAFPWYETQIAFTKGADGGLSGDWKRDSATFGKETMPFRAKPVAKPDASALYELPAPDAAAKPVDIAGVWQLEFEEQDGARIAIAEPSPGVVDIAVRFETSDVADIPLSGNRAGNAIRVSSFDGNYAYVMHAEFAPDGKSLSGRWFAGTAITDTLTGQRTQASEMPPTVPVTGEGPTLPLAGEPAYAGKPLLVDIGASWCPPCQRSAPFLRELYDTYNPRGLQIVTLLYEFTEDPATNKTRAAEFKKAHGAPWEVRAIDTPLGDFGKNLPEDLGLTINNLKSLPIMLLVDAKGHVRHVHTGFVGPEVPEEHEKLKAYFRQRLDELVPKQ